LLDSLLQEILVESFKMVNNGQGSELLGADVLHCQAPSPDLQQELLPGVLTVGEGPIQGLE